MVLDDASERRFLRGKQNSTGDKNSKDNTVTYFADVPLGMYIVRGDSIVLLGQVGSENEEEERGADGQSTVTLQRMNLDELEAAADSEGSDDQPEVSDEGTSADVSSSKSLEWDFDKDLLAWNNNYLK